MVLFFSEVKDILGAGDFMRRRGFILPFTIILALVVLTSLGLWYRQTVLQSFLADRLLRQRGYYIECRSLIPTVLEKLEQASLTALETGQTGFLIIEVDHQPRWQIDRSAWSNDRIRFSFKRMGRNEEPVVLTVPYHRSQVSGFPPDLSAE